MSTTACCQGECDKSHIDNYMAVGLFVLKLVSFSGSRKSRVWHWTALLIIDAFHWHSWHRAHSTHKQSKNTWIAVIECSLGGVSRGLDLLPIHLISLCSQLQECMTKSINSAPVSRLPKWDGRVINLCSDHWLSFVIHALERAELIHVSAAKGVKRSVSGGSPHELQRERHVQLCSRCGAPNRCWQSLVLILI